MGIKRYVGIKSIITVLLTAGVIPLYAAEDSVNNETKEKEITLEPVETETEGKQGKSSKDTATETGNTKNKEEKENPEEVREKKDKAETKEKEITLEPVEAETEGEQEKSSKNTATDAEADTDRGEKPETGTTPVQERDTTSREEDPALTKMPELTEFVKAEYPDSLQRKGTTGRVKMELLISDSGTVDSAEVTGSLHPVLDSCALKAAEDFVFTPAEAEGETIPVIIEYHYSFNLEETIDSIQKVLNFSGRLLERGTRKPVKEAMVVVEFNDTTPDAKLPVPFREYINSLDRFDGQYIEEGRLVTLTDSTGRFEFYSLPACTLSVTSPVSGYESFSTKEWIQPGKETSADYYIRRVSYSDLEVTVYGQKEKKEVSRRELSTTEVKTIPGFGGDAVKVVQSMPGVARPRFMSGAVVVRGSPSWDSRFYLDGVDIPVLYHFGGLKSTYNSEALESVDFYPGGWGTKYGNGIAGVIEINSRDPETDRFHGYCDLGLIDGSFMIEGPVTDKLSILLTARRSFMGEVLNFANENSDIDIPYSVYTYYWDYVGRVNYEISDNSSLFLTGFGSKDSLDFLVPEADRGNKDIDEELDKLKYMNLFNLGIAGWDTEFSERLENTLRMSIQRAKSSSSAFAMFKWEDDYTEFYIRDQLTYKSSDKLSLNFGADLSWLPYDLVLIISDYDTGLPLRDTTENMVFGDLGTYINAEIRPNEKLLITPGFRYDYYPELIHSGSIIPELWDYDFDNNKGISGEPSFRVSSRYKFIEDHTAKASLGTYSQTPKPMGQVTHERWGEPDMPATKGRHVVAGYEWQITDLLHLDLQGYLNRQWNVPRVTDDSEISENDRLWYPDSKARMKGLEIMLRHNKGNNFFGWLSYSLSKSERWDPVEKEWYIYSEDETHNLQAVASLFLKKDWQIGTRIRFVSGKPTYRVDSTAYNAHEMTYSIYKTTDEDVRLNPFFQVDFRVDKKFVFPKWILSFYLDIQNLSYPLYKSPEFTVYDDFYEERATISSILFPALGVKAEF
ncbi:MAG: TonB-dependent receptor domain-containing protein [Chitinivibrionales bacterium]